VNFFCYPCSSKAAVLQWKKNGGEEACEAYQAFVSAGGVADFGGCLLLGPAGL
jgi:hypothetical protein